MEHLCACIPPSQQTHTPKSANSRHNLSLLIEIHSLLTNDFFPIYQFNTFGYIKWQFATRNII